MPFYFKKTYLLFFIVPILSGLIFYSFLFGISEVEANTSVTTSLSIGITVYDPIGGGGVPWWRVPPKEETKVVLEGKAYPEALITVLVDGKVFTLVTADSEANFRVELTNLTAGNYTFGFWAEDKEGRKSITFSFGATVSPQMTTVINNLLIPPTVEFEKTSINKGETLNISGQTVPQGEVIIYFELAEETIVRKTIANDKGEWNYSFDTSELEEGFYSVKAKTLSSEDLTSSFSNVLKFGVGKELVEGLCPRTDFNKDEEVNLVDFSILLYWWGRYNACVDQNQDGIVDLYDFSILMYYWTG